MSVNFDKIKGHVCIYIPDISTVLLVIGNEELKQILDIPGTVEEHNLEVSLLFSVVIAKLLAFRV